MAEPRSDYLSAALYTRDEVLARPCPVPAVGGVYGWWFDTLPSTAIDATHCQSRDGMTLLYVGISPSRPPANGGAPSRQTIRHRIRNHCRGNAAGSTLRLTLGSLLADDLGLELRRTGSGTKRHFHNGEAAISAWMSRHACVSWIEHPQPWLLEDELIAELDLPLNLMGNQRHPFHPTLSAARSAMAQHANAMPVVATPRRASPR